jgi:hypothetical protein
MGMQSIAMAEKLYPTDEGKVQKQSYSVNIAIKLYSSPTYTEPHFLYGTNYFEKPLVAILGASATFPPPQLQP